MKQIKVATYRVQKELLDLIQKDADAFGPLAGAYRMPTNTEEERESKARVMEASLKEACLVPLEMMKLCAEAIGLLERTAVIGNRLALSDAACGAVLAAAAMRSAWMNVAVNTFSIRDGAFARRVNDEGMALMDEYAPRAERIYEAVERKYRRDGRCVLFAFARRASRLFQRASHNVRLSPPRARFWLLSARRNSDALRPAFRP
jgi:formiminotetrahydrofolate cyclodeaminase